MIVLSTAFSANFGSYRSLPHSSLSQTADEIGHVSQWSLWSLAVGFSPNVRCCLDCSLTLCCPDPYFHPIVSSWISENTFDVKKRAITAATYNVIVQIGSLIGSQIYRSYDSPYYHQGNKVLISICALALVTFLVQRAYLGILNKRKEKIWETMTVEERSAYQNDQAAREMDGNRRLDFRFKYWIFSRLEHGVWGSSVLFWGQTIADVNLIPNFFISLQNF